MADMQNFSKLPAEKQLSAVRKLIATFPKSEQERLVRETVVDVQDQEQMIKELKENE